MTARVYINGVPDLKYFDVSDPDDFGNYCQRLMLSPYICGIYAGDTFYPRQSILKIEKVIDENYST